MSPTAARASSWTRRPTSTTEAKLLLIGIPVLIWTMLPIYHLVLFAISPQGPGDRRQALARPSDAAQLRDRVPRAASLPQPLLAADVELADHRGRGRRAHALRRHRRRVRDQPAQGARRPHGDEPGAVHLFHPGRVPRRADVQDDGQLRPAQQPVVADPGDGDDRHAVLDLGAEAGLRQAAVRARRGGADRRRVAAAAVSPRLPAADDAVAGGGRHLRAAARLERIPVRVPAPVERHATSRSASRSATSSPPTIRRGSC